MKSSIDIVLEFVQQCTIKFINHGFPEQQKGSDENDIMIGDDVMEIDVRPKKKKKWTLVQKVERSNRIMNRFAK